MWKGIDDVHRFLFFYQQSVAVTDLKLINSVPVLHLEHSSMCHDTVYYLFLLYECRCFFFFWLVFWLTNLDCISNETPMLHFKYIKTATFAITFAFTVIYCNWIETHLMKKKMHD